MKTSLWRRWCNSLLGTRPTGPAARVRPRRRPLGLNPLEDRVTPTLTPQMVADINSITDSANPSWIVTVGAVTYFTADDRVHGTELWRTDGTEAGTTMVRDLNPGSGSSIPAGLTELGGTLYFTADNGATGRELWKTDGTPAGTVLVKDIRPGPTGADPYAFRAFNGSLYFSADNGTNGRELWKSDGTTAGTTLLKDIDPGSGTGIYGGSFPYSSYPGGFTIVNGTLFFSAADGPTGPELWKTDGTAAGTVRIKDINPGTTGSWPGWLTDVNGTLFFQAYTLATGYELWKSDGTATGTVLVKDIAPGNGRSYPSYLTTVGGTLYFTADDETSGTELWKTNGTATGTVRVKDINPNGSAGPRELTVLNGTLFFSANDGATGHELWKTDGTAAGTTRVADINPGNGVAWPNSLTILNGALYFSADDGSTGAELWKTDGTAAGTARVADLDPGSGGSSPFEITTVNGKLLFGARDARHGAELWTSDGTAAGTTRVKDINTVTFGSDPRNLVDVAGTLFFTADDGATGPELWATDGTAAGTRLVKDLGPGGTGSYLTNLTAVNGTLFFTRYDEEYGSELWRSDGTAAGTTLVKDIYPGFSWTGNWYYGYVYVPNSSSPSNLMNMNGTLFFTAADGPNGTELWKSDGTAAGTVLVKDVNPGTGGSNPRELENVNGTLFFTAYDAANGTELWKSDGTTAGTTLVTDIYSGTTRYYFPYYGGYIDFPNSSNPGELTNVNGTLFFTAYEPTAGTELWKSDGTAAGTVLVKDINPGGSGSLASSSNWLTDVNGTLFLAAYDGTQVELWKSDGTAAGTVLVKDIRPGSASSFPNSLTSANGTLFFSANDGTFGSELWASDGTPAGTRLVKDIAPGAADAAPGQFTVVDGTLFFAAAGSKLWQTDGTAAGTVLAANLAVGSLRGMNDTLYFTANDGIHGHELWRLADAVTVEMSGFPATVTAGAAGSFTVTAKNPDGSTNSDYRGTVHFTSTDLQAALPADYAFTAADLGVHTFTATLKTAGSQSITVSDTIVPGVAGTQTGITVNPAAASRFTVAGFPSPVTAGVAGSFTVTAQDAYGNRATGYTGTGHFTSTDVQAALPGNYTFTAADAGMHTFSAVLKTADIRFLAATDTANAAVTGGQYVTVNPAAASRLLISAPASVNANAQFSLTVTVVDAYGNVVTGYRGKITFRSSDQTARLPRKYTFTAADQGVHTFTNLVLKGRGTQTITVTDTLISGLTTTVSIVVR